MWRTLAQSARSRLFYVPEDLPQRLARACAGKGVCSVSMEPHVVLQGWSPRTRFRTSIAELCPRAFCTQFAGVLSHAHEPIRLERRWCLVSKGGLRPHH
eukprot:9446695-Lingulodinium_polyedra.AAC.1